MEKFPHLQDSFSEALAAELIFLTNAVNLM